ncbi:MAG TPA: GntR family transcriptional regulator [Steroidobacteraceae bacterium]|jgi:DNA-binding FadR family transcriptional regulator|nr:GntR family transcriptional regulator [Steroidobacteraceae bacterium]
MSIEFEQIRTEPAYRKVAAALMERILDRTLRDGDRLPSETELARQFGVNRSTVREAVRELESNGLVARRKGSKLLVVTRPQADRVAARVGHALVMHDVTYHDVWEALTVLEPPIAEMAARKRTEADLAQISGAAGNFATDNAETARAAFHAAEFFRIVGAATHNRILMLAQEPLLQLLDASLQRMLDKVPQSRARITAAQRRITDAIRERDVETARAWMTRHIRDFRKGYELAGIDLNGRVDD